MIDIFVGIVDRKLTQLDLENRTLTDSEARAVMTIVREFPDNAFVKGGLFKKFGVDLPKPWKQLFTRRRETWETRMEGVEEVE